MKIIFPKRSLLWIIPVIIIVAGVGVGLRMNNSSRLDLQTAEQTVVSEVTPAASDSIMSLDAQASTEPNNQTTTETVTEQQPEKKKTTVAPQPAPSPIPAMPAFTPTSAVTGILTADPVCFDGRQYVYTSVSYSSYTYTGPVSYTLQLSATGQTLDGFYTSQQFSFDITAGGSYATPPNSFTFEYPRINAGASMKVTLTTNSPGSQQAGMRTLTNICP